MNNMEEYNLCEDTYFIDRDSAYKAALAHNTVLLPNGKKDVQLCFYDGQAFDQAPDNLINVPLEKFAEIFSAQSYRLPTKIDITELSPALRTEYESNFTKLVSKVKHIRAVKRTYTEDASFQDALFLDPQAAYETAIMQNPVKSLHPSVFGTQICYYEGKVFPDAPSNLVRIEFDNLLDYLSNTNLRYPSAIVFPENVDPKHKASISDSFRELIQKAENQRAQYGEIYLKNCKQQKPIFTQNSAIRVFLSTTRYTEVMQYSMKNLASAFANAGCEVKFFIEQDGMQRIDNPWLWKEHYEFNPHVVVNINHMNNAWLHPDVINIVWWQDPMHEIWHGQKLKWRSRDIVFSAYPQFDKLLEKTGVKTVHRQGFCVNNDIFKPRVDIPRKNKIVFIGSSYNTHLHGVSKPVRDNAIKLIEHMRNGEALTYDLVKSYNDECDGNFRYFWNYLFNYVVRDTAVQWMCQAKNIDIEVYGRHWENDHIVKPYYKGSLPHGEAVAEVYAGSKYALIAVPHEVNSQRLSEVAACGCIPIVYDCRHLAEKPHWDEQCLYFRTQQELYQCLNKTPSQDPMEIARFNTYSRAVNNMLNLIEPYFYNELAEA